MSDKRLQDDNPPYQHIIDLWNEIPESSKWFTSLILIIFVDTFLTYYALETTVNSFREINPIIRIIMEQEFHFVQKFIILIFIKSMAMGTIWMLWHYALDITWQKKVAINMTYYLGVLVVVWNIINLLSGYIYF